MFEIMLSVRACTAGAGADAGAGAGRSGTSPRSDDTVSRIVTIGM